MKMTTIFFFFFPVRAVIARELGTTWIIPQEEEDGPALSFLHPHYAILVSISPPLQENDPKIEKNLSSILPKQFL
jgi:hypothetical protein